MCNDHAARDRHAGRPSKEEKNKYEQATKSWKQKQAVTQIQNARLLEHAMDK